MSSLRWRATLLLLICTLLIVACGAPRSKSVAPAEKTKVIIFVGFGTGTDPDQVSAQDALAKKFNDAHDDITVEFMIVPHDQATARYLELVAEDNAPQLVGPLGIATVAQFFDQWQDITPYIEKDGYDLSDFYGPAVTLNKYPNLNVGLPLGLYPSFLFYNKDVFDAAGLPYPSHDYHDKAWNISALEQMAIQLTLDAHGNNATSADFDASNIKQWGYADTGTDFRGQMTMFGAPNTGRPASADYKSALVNSAEWKYGAKWLHSGVHQKHFMPDAVGQGAIDSASGDPFGGGHVAIWYSHTWYMAEGLHGLPFEFDIAPLFYNQKGERIARVHADLFTIPKNAKHKDAAWEVMKWLVAPEQIIDVCTVYGCLPARKSVESLFEAKLKERFPTIDHGVIFHAIEYLDAPNHESYVPEWRKVNDTLNNTLTTIYTESSADTDALLDTTNQDVQTIFDDYWATHP